MSDKPIDLLSKGEALRADYVRMHAELVIAVRKLRASLAALVRVNEEWNAAVQTVIQKPPGWNDSYLDASRKVLEETKEYA